MKSLGALALAGFAGTSQAATVGSVELGGLTDYLFVFTDGNKDANWQSSSKGYVGDVAINGVTARERTSGTVPYAGTIVTNDSSLGAWQDIVNANPGQAGATYNATTTISDLSADLQSAFSQINGLSASTGFESVASGDLNGLNTQNGVSETFVVNVTSGLSTSSLINITGDADDYFILRWDDDLATTGYQGQTKFQSGGGINPLGGLLASNFVNVAGNINASGGGSNPGGLSNELLRIDDIDGGSPVNGGGFFTGYWLTTGDPDKDYETSSLSNAIFVGGWYSSTTKFSMTSGTSGVHVAAPDVAPVPLPASFWLLGAAAAGLTGVRRLRRRE